MAEGREKSLRKAVEALVAEFGPPPNEVCAGPCAYCAAWKAVRAALERLGECDPEKALEELWAETRRLDQMDIEAGRGSAHCTHLAKWLKSRGTE